MQLRYGSKIKPLNQNKMTAIEYLVQKLELGIY